MADSVDSLYIPGVATGCWVSAEQVAENESVWLNIGAQRIALAKAGTADSEGWRPIWWFSQDTHVPLCLCTCTYVSLHPCMPDGSQDTNRTLKAKWRYHEPSDELKDIMQADKQACAQYFKEGGLEAGKPLPCATRVTTIPLKYPGNTATKYSLLFAGGMARMNLTGKATPEDPDFYRL